jgi:CRISPR-associated protein Csd1
MLVQALANYAYDRLQEQLNDEAWEEKPVPHYIAITPDGTFLNLITNQIQVVKGKKTVSVPAQLKIPRSPVPRNAGLYPLLAADDIKYVLGAGPWTAKGQEENNQQRHSAFVDLIRDSAHATHDDGLEAATHFYERPDQVEAARAALSSAKPGTQLALALGLEPIVNRPAVRNHWTSLYKRAAAGRVAETERAECLITGKIGPVAPTHEKIKGLGLGGQSSGVALMSFDKDAFCSYGWDQCANSPVSPESAMAYVLALNDLLRRDKNQRRDVAGIGFIFWTRKAADEDPFETLNNPDPDQIQRLLSWNQAADPDPNMFYMAGLGATGGRMIVRYWIAETLASVKAHLRDWFEQLRIADAFTGAQSPPPKLWELLRAIDREGEPPAERTLDFFRRAIEGKPLGIRILAAALGRLRIAKKKERINAARAGLIRLCVNDSIRTRKQPGEPLMEERLDPAQHHPAYLCGRLMAVYESLQYTASGEVNQTVADRYFSLASTYPAQAFPKLEDLGNKHLRKLRRDNRGAMVRIGETIDQLHLQIEQASGYRFPGPLDIESQGRFALGYHHQRAHNMAEAKAHKNQKQEPTFQENPQA